MGHYAVVLTVSAQIRVSGRESIRVREAKIIIFSTSALMGHSQVDTCHSQVHTIGKLGLHGRVSTSGPKLH